MLAKILSDHHHNKAQGDAAMAMFKTLLLMAAMTALFLVAGLLMGGTKGMLIALAIAVVTNLLAYWNSDRMVLRMQGAKPISEAESPEYHDMVRRLATRAGLPMPKLYVIQSDQPNAFATGRNPENAAVAATTGLLRILNRDEIEGVIAHELAHVKNRDTLIMTLTATFAGAISMLANFAMFFGGGGRSEDRPFGAVGSIAMFFLAPMAAMVVQTAISRTREYEADRLGARISGKPRALAAALIKIHNAVKGHLNHRAEANPAQAHLYIMNPLSGARMDNLFSTHPDTQNRIDELEELARTMESEGQIVSEDQSFRGPWSDDVPPLPRSNQNATRGPWG
jgi:heat shock protein HtpX